MAVAAVECVAEAEAPMPRVSAWLRCPWWWLGLSQKSRMQFDRVKFQ